jgi:hypothetical protein
MAWSRPIEARVRSLLLAGLEDLVREIVWVDSRLHELGDSDGDEVEEIVLTAYRAVLVEEVLSIINYLESAERGVHEKAEEAAAATA